MEGFSPEEIKQLKIKTGVVSRIRKEVLSYRKEEETQKTKIQKLKETVLQECVTCHEQGEKRLAVAAEELDAYIQTKFKSLLGNIENVDIEGVAADVRKAEIAINEARETLPTIATITAVESEDEDDI